MDGNSKDQFYLQQQDSLAAQLLSRLQDGSGFTTVSLPEGFTLQAPANAALVSSSASALESSQAQSSLSQASLSTDGIILNSVHDLDPALVQLLASAGIGRLGSGDGSSSRDLHPILAATLASAGSLESAIQLPADPPPPDPPEQVPTSSIEAINITIQCTMRDTVIVVGQQNWQCCMCKQINGFDVSIDQHMALKHSRQLGPVFSTQEDVKVPQSGLCTVAFPQPHTDNSATFPQPHQNSSSCSTNNFSQPCTSSSFDQRIPPNEPLQTISQQALASLKIPEERHGSAGRSGLEREVAMLMAQTFTHPGDGVDDGVGRHDLYSKEKSGLFSSYPSTRKGSHATVAHGPVTVFDKMINKVHKAMRVTADDGTKNDLLLVANELAKMHKDTTRRNKLRRNGRYIPCGECGKQIRNRKDLIVQHNRSHDKTKRYRCLVCNKMFKYMHTLKRHVAGQGHEGGLPPENEREPSNADDSIDYITHADSCMPMVKSEFETETGELLIADVDFILPTDKQSGSPSTDIVLDTGKPAYEKIMTTLLSKGERCRTAEGKKLTLVQCFVCDKEVRNRSYYIRRHSRCHLDTLCYTCCYCSEEFYRSDHYKLHMNKHKNIDEDDEDDDESNRSSLNDDDEETSKTKDGDEKEKQSESSTVTCKICDQEIENNAHNIKQHAELHSIADWESIVDADEGSPESEMSKQEMLLKASGSTQHIIQCLVCSLTFKTQALKRIHMLKHRSSFLCYRCQGRFATLAEKQTHLQTCKGILEDEDENAVDGQATRGRKKIHKVPEKRPADGEKYTCTVCKANIFNTPQSIKRHMRELHSEGQPHPCTRCTRIYDTYHKLQRHIKTHNDKGGVCDICGKMFLTRPALRAHTKLHAGEEGMFQCPKCPRSFRFKGRLDKHLVKHAQKAIFCPHCNRSYLSKIHLRRHISVEHLGVKDYRHKCNQCSAQFFESIQLRDHIAYRHKGIQLYTCKFCNQGFNCRPTMVRHVRQQHTNDFPYKCKHCNMGFAEKSKLVSHEMTVTGVSPFHCTVCSKFFTTSSALKAHCNLHQHALPLTCPTCPVCRKTYSKLWHLQQHMRKSHPEVARPKLAASNDRRKPTPAASNMVFDPQENQVVFQQTPGDDAGADFDTQQSQDLPVIDASVLQQCTTVDTQQIDVKYLSQVATPMSSAQVIGTQKSSRGTVTISLGSGTVSTDDVSLSSLTSVGSGVQPLQSNTPGTSGSASSNSMTQDGSCLQHTAADIAQSIMQDHGQMVAQPIVFQIQK